MCGINGILGRVSDASLRIARMNDALAHRGPDAEGVFTDQNVSLGHRRLSIIDLTEGANQPMTDDSGRYTLVFNGEIYNYATLRGKLTSYSFRTSSDTEVLLAGLIRCGIDFLKDCNGMFAFAFWDAEHQRLMVGRDRLGIKPLYYARRDDVLVFSSEIRAILASGLIPKSINRLALPEYLRYQTVHGANTMVEGVFSLPTGSCMISDPDEERIETYWHLVTQTDRLPPNLTFKEANTIIKSRFTSAVERRLIADVPFGAFLSGGIDSSAIVAVAAKKVSSPLRTFTVVFDDAEFNEAHYARIVSEKYGTDHAEIKLSPISLIDQLPSAISAMDHPSGDGINTYVVSKAAREAGITMVLSGLGGDELFAGYPVFKQIAALQDQKWLLSYPKFVRKAFGQLRSMIKPGVASQKIGELICEDYFDVEYAFQYSREVASRTLVQELLNVPNGSANAVFNMVHEAVGYDTSGFRLPLLSKISYAEISTYMQSVLLRDTDQMSMASALEVRVPFLDHELVQSVMALPDGLKYPHTPKALFVSAMADLLPDEIVNRPKMGFTFPWDGWLRKELKDFCGDHIASLARRPEFNEEALIRRWNKFIKRDKHVGWSRIWYLSILQAWLDKNEIN